MRKQAPFSIVLLLAFSGFAFAEQRPAVGHTSGPAMGRNVTPSTVAQKLFEGRSVFAADDILPELEASSLAAGSPGVAGKPGTQSGGAPQGRDAASKAVY